MSERHSTLFVGLGATVVGVLLGFAVFGTPAAEGDLRQALGVNEVHIIPVDTSIRVGETTQFGAWTYDPKQGVSTDHITTDDDVRWRSRDESKLISLGDGRFKAIAQTEGEEYLIEVSRVSGEKVVVLQIQAIIVGA